MYAFKMPLSGDVTQWIAPWATTISTLGSQFGFVNINMGRSSDRALESEILEQVGTYGRQLGRIGDTLAVLLNHLDPARLTPQEEDAIQAFKVQMYEIAQLKKKRARDVSP